MGSKQGFFEGDDAYQERTAREADEQSIAETAGEAPRKGFFESDDTYRDRIAQEAREGIIESSTGSRPGQRFFESADSYGDRLEREANARIVEDRTGHPSRRRLLEGEESFRIRERREANEELIREGGARTARQRLFEGDHTYRSRIAHEARQIRADPERGTFARSPGSDRSRQASGGGSGPGSSGGGPGVGAIVALISIVAVAVIFVVEQKKRPAASRPRRVPQAVVAPSRLIAYTPPTKYTDLGVQSRVEMNHDDAISVLLGNSGELLLLHPLGTGVHVEVDIDGSSYSLATSNGGSDERLWTKVLGTADGQFRVNLHCTTKLDMGMSATFRHR